MGELISQFEFFAGLSPEQVAAIATITEHISVKKGEVIFKEAQKADKLYFLKEGKVSLQIQLSSSPEKVVVALVNKGFGFGWSAMVDPFHYTASAIAEEDSQLVAIDGKEFIKILDEDPTAGYLIFQRIAAIVSKRLRNSRSALLKTL